MTKRYNGWENYETWCVNLWLGNDQGSDTYWREAAQEAFDEAEADHPLTRSEKARHVLADRLKDEVHEGVPDESTMYSDLLGAALSEVNWGEVADGFLEDAEDSETDEKYEATAAVAE